MTVQDSDLLLDFQGHLAYWSERLRAVDPADTEKLNRIRSFVAHYERQVAEIKARGGGDA